MNNGVPLDPRQIDRWVRDMKANDEAYARQQAAKAEAAAK